MTSDRHDRATSRDAQLPERDAGDSYQHHAERDVSAEKARNLQAPDEALRRAESTAGNVLRREHDRARERMKGTGDAVGGLPSTSVTAGNESNEGAPGPGR